MNTKRHPRTKLTHRDVIVARQLCGEGIPVGRIAREFGVSRTTLRSAVLGFTWKWLWNSAA